jgi:NAD(P)H-flavin reductase
MTFVISKPGVPDDRCNHQYWAYRSKEQPAMFTVECIEEGEVSPYLMTEVRPGDRFELRGPHWWLLAGRQVSRLAVRPLARDWGSLMFAAPLNW